MREASIGGQFGWVMFDWANQPFFTLITTFIFAPYFATQVVGDPIQGQALWGYGQAVAGALIAIGAPVLGAIADALGRRKPWILAFQAITVVGCVALWWAEPNPEAAIRILAFVVVATVGAEFSIVFNNAMLPKLVGPERIGWLSGLGWAAGYTGGLISLALFLLVLRPDLAGMGEEAFALDRGRFAPERLSGPFAAVWLVLFVWPLFLFTPDAKAKGSKAKAAIGSGLRSLAATLRRFRHEANPLLFLLSFMLYNNGLLAVIAFAGVYLAGVFAWGSEELGLFGVLTTISAMIGAVLGGLYDRAFGSKRTVLAALSGVALATVGMLSIGPKTLLFVIDVEAEGALAVLPLLAVYGFSLLLGFCMGPMQAASRALMGRIAPDAYVAEFYGLFALAGRATAFLAPFLIAVATQAFASQRAGLIVVLGFFAAGFLLFLRVREEQMRA
jgi:UMF1 family MFS transporter